MPLKLLRVVPTPTLSKKYAAVYVLPNGRQRTVRFGTASNYVSNPRKTARDRAAYIARHRVNENHGDPLTPGAPLEVLGIQVGGHDRSVGVHILQRERPWPSITTDRQAAAAR